MKKIITRWLSRVAFVGLTIILGVCAGCACVWLDEVDLTPEQEDPAPIEEIAEPVVQYKIAEIQLPVIDLEQVVEAIPEEPAEAPVEEAVPAADPAPVEELPAHGYTDEELLALVIYQEAGGDAYSDDTRLKVGTVVMNRVASDRYPDTIYEVLTQRAQYGRLYWTGIKWPDRATSQYEAHAVERAYACARRILAGERFLPEDVVYQAEFPQGTEVVARAPGFYFCR